MAKKEIAAEWININKLSAWKDNPRLNESAIEAVMKSISKFGFGAPILARKENMMIIAGHSRFEAAKRLEMDKVPVRILDLTDENAKMLAIADNKISELSFWDSNKLDSLINEMSSDGFDLDGLGFTQLELDSILNVLDDDQYINPESDWEKEWTGMPDYEQEDDLPFKTLKIHFKDQDAIDKFCSILNVKINPKTRFLFYPKLEAIKEVGINEYVSE